MKRGINKKNVLILISLGTFFIFNRSINSINKNNLHIANKKIETQSQKDDNKIQKDKDSLEKEVVKIVEDKNNTNNTENINNTSNRETIENTNNPTSSIKNKKSNQETNENSIKQIPKNSETIDYKNKIKIDGNVSLDLINLLNDELNKVPKNIMNKYLNMGGKIILTSHDIATTYYNDYVIGSLMELYDARQQILYVSARSNAIKRGVVHGFGHIVDHISGWRSYKTNTFISIYNEEKNKFTPINGGKYHKTNEREFFAEIFYNLIKSPDTAKSTSPKASSFIIDVIEEI